MASHGRESLVVQLARTIQQLPLAWLRHGEQLFLRHSPRSRLRMIILLALPRSGSTLTYQTMIHAFQPMYLSNLGNLLYQLPLCGGWLTQHGHRGYQSDFQSEYGFVPGLWGPAEGRQFWEYWMGCALDERYPPKVPAEPGLKARLDYLRSVLTAFSSEGRPVVTGFLGHALIPARVQQAFPEAVVLRLWREPVSNALSILKSRHASGTAWFSLFPRECEQRLDASEHEQVAAQIYWLNRRLDDACGGTQVVWMNYEALCANPTREMQRLANACRPMGLQLALRNRLPDHFPCRQVDVEQDADAARLACALRTLERQHGKLQGMPDAFLAGRRERHSRVPVATD